LTRRAGFAVRQGNFSRREFNRLTRFLDALGLSGLSARVTRRTRSSRTLAGMPTFREFLDPFPLQSLIVIHDDSPSAVFSRFRRWRVTDQRTDA
jgi:hypothetical protein